MHLIGGPLSHPLLTAPIGKSLWKLSAPTTAVMIVQTFVAIARLHADLALRGLQKSKIKGRSFRARRLG